MKLFKIPSNERITYIDIEKISYIEFNTEENGLNCYIRMSSGDRVGWFPINVTEEEFMNQIRVLINRAVNPIARVANPGA